MRISGLDTERLTMDLDQMAARSLLTVVQEVEELTDRFPGGKVEPGVSIVLAHHPCTSRRSEKALGPSIRSPG